MLYVTLSYSLLIFFLPFIHLTRHYSRTQACTADSHSWTFSATSSNFIQSFLIGDVLLYIAKTVIKILAIPFVLSKLCTCQGYSMLILMRLKKLNYGVSNLTEEFGRGSKYMLTVDNTNAVLWRRSIQLPWSLDQWTTTINDQ